LSAQGAVCDEVKNKEISSKAFQVDGFWKNQEASGLCESYPDQEELEKKAKSSSMDRCVCSGYQAG
jgi:hypothetical protein